MNKKYVGIFLIFAVACTYFWTTTGKTAFGVTSAAPYTGEYLIAINSGLDIKPGNEISTGTLPKMSQQPVSNLSMNGEQNTSDMPIKIEIEQPIIDIDISDYVPEIEINKSMNGSVNATAMAEGTRKTFSVLDCHKKASENDPDVYANVPATLVKTSEHYNIWVEDKNLPGHTDVDITDEMINKLEAKVSGELYPLMQNKYGDHSIGDVDGDGKLNVFLTDVQDNYDPYVNRGYVGGFFSPMDLLKKYNPNFYVNSNGMDIIYIDTYPGLNAPGGINEIEQCYGTLAHETQHFLNFSYTFLKDLKQKQMDTWINEMLSESASYMFTGVSERHAQYNDSKNIKNGVTSLIRWDGSLENYALGLIFSIYIDNLTSDLPGGGGEIFRKIVESGKIDSTAVTTALASVGYNIDFSKLYENFRIALVAKQPTGEYGFKNDAFINKLGIPLYEGESAMLAGGSAVVKKISNPNVGVERPSNANVGIKFYGVGEQPTIGPMVTLDRKTHDKNTQATDLIATISPATYTFDGISNGVNKLIKNADYTVLENTVSIKMDYLNALPIGVTTLSFEFLDGSDRIKLNSKITISDTTTQARHTQPTVSNVVRNGANVSLVLGSDIGTNDFEVNINGVANSVTASAGTLNLDSFITKAGDYNIRVFAKESGGTLKSFPSFVYAFENNAIAIAQATAADVETMTELEKTNCKNYILKSDYLIPPNATEEEKKKYLPSKMTVKLDIPLEDGSRYAVVPVDFTNYTQ